MSAKWKTGMHCKRKAVRLCYMAAVLACLFLSGCGKEEKDLYGFIGTEPKEIDPWAYLQDTALSGSAQIRGLASSAGNQGITIGVMGIVFSLLIMAVRIFFSGSVRTRSEIREEALIKGLVAVMIFSEPLWLGICKLFGEALA